MSDALPADFGNTVYATINWTGTVQPLMLLMSGANAARYFACRALSMSGPASANVKLTVATDPKSIFKVGSAITLYSFDNTGTVQIGQGTIVDTPVSP